MRVGTIIDTRKPDPNHVHSDKCWRDIQGPVILWLCGQEPFRSPNTERERQHVPNQAKRLAEAIRFNVEEYHLEIVSYERFTARNVRLWSRARAWNVTEQVAALVRPAMKGATQQIGCGWGVKADPEEMRQEPEDRRSYPFV